LNIVAAYARGIGSKLSYYFRIISTAAIDDNSFERVEGFKYLGTTLTNQNSIQEELKSRLK
jgi:hypothetical protein